jgi:UDP-sulfoquinovose synthase
VSQGGLRATDLNQGVVYGQETPETALHGDLATRFDYDAVFGTVLNRFVVQAVADRPLTVYGSGGQTRGLINILDTMACIELALKNPARRGEFRVFNQFTESLSVAQMAKLVQEALGGRPRIEHLEDPRVEAQDHYYNAVHTKLLDLGLQPHLLNNDVIRALAAVAARHEDRIDEKQMLPLVSWKLRRVERLTPLDGSGNASGNPPPAKKVARLNAG